MAQFTSIIQGVVRDPTGAVIVGAAVRLSSRDTGIYRDVLSDQAGFYRFTALAMGRYELTLKSSGFQIVSVEVPLGPAQTAEVNVTLRLLTVSVTEWVMAPTPLPASQDAITGQQIGRRAIENLPLLNRTLFDLAYLAPGVTAPPGSAGQPNNFVSNGNRNATADVLLDRVSTVNIEQNGGVQLPLYTPAVDAIEEFRVEQSNFSAEIGFSGSTVVNLVTRSGTNDLHGSAYEYLRNDHLDANNFFNNRSGVPLPPLRRNQFGATAGGPVRRNRTFFFADYDGTRARSMVTRSAGVPSPAMRNGDFGEICTAKGGSFSADGLCSVAAGQIWDPYSSVYRAQLGGPERTAFIPFNNLARYMSPGAPALNGTRFQLAARPGNLIDPVAARLMALYPLPTATAGTPGYSPYQNWTGSGTDRNDIDQFDIKLDHRFRTDQLSVKFAYRRDGYEYANLFNDWGDVNTQGPGTGGARLVAINDTHTFGSRTLLMTAFGITRQLQWTRGITGAYPGLDPIAELGLPSYMAASGVDLPPSVLVGGGYASVGFNASVGGQPWSSMKYGQQTVHLVSTLGHVVGRHELRIGAEARGHYINFFQPGTPNGWFIFDNHSTSQLPSSSDGDAMAGFLMGVASPNTGRYEIPVAVSTFSLQYAAFVQDNWRVTDRLTLNLGLRYDVDLPRTERYNRMSWIDPTIPSPVSVPRLGPLSGGLQFAGRYMRSPYDTDWDNVAPRFGLAWQMTRDTVLRGGYGIFYSLSKVGAAGTGAGGFQGFSQNTPWQVTYQNDGATPFGRLSDPLPDGILYPTGRTLGALTGVASGITGPVRSWNASPYVQSWTFGLQHQLPFSVLVDASYVGNKGTKLYFGGGGELDIVPESVASRFQTESAYLNAMVPNPFHGLPGYETGPLSGPAIPRWQLYLPFPQFPNVTATDPPCASSIYHAFQLRVDKRWSGGLQFLVTYTISKSIDDASVAGPNVRWLGGAISLQDPNNRRLERSLSYFDIPQAFQVGWVYELPFGHRKSIGSGWNRWTDALLGGWQTNGIWRFSGGMPLALTLMSGQAIPTYGAQRPNLSAPLRMSPHRSLDAYFLNPEAVVAPGPYTIGNAPRTMPDLRAPGVGEGSMSLFKQFELKGVGERAHLEYRVEAFNILNHPRFGPPDTAAGDATFGQTVSQANLPRQVQVGVKLFW